MIDKRLRVLQMVQHHGTITAAAEALHYTPSAVSHQIKQLSADLDVELLESVGRGVRLTDAAHTALAYAADLFVMEEELRSKLSTADSASGGTFAMCGFSTAASRLLPPAAAQLRRSQRPRSLTIYEAEPHRCFDLLISGAADLALITPTSQTPPTADPRFEQHHLLDDPLDIIVAANHPLAGSSSVGLDELADENWIIGHPDSAYHSLVYTACASAGFTPSAAHYAEEWETGTSLAAHGFGIMLVPRLAQLNPAWPVVRIPLSGTPAPARRIVAATRKGAWNDRLVAAALKAIRHTARGILPE